MLKNELTCTLNLYITFVCEIGLGGRELSQMKRGVEKKGGQDPLTPPPLDTPMTFIKTQLSFTTVTKTQNRNA